MFTGGRPTPTVLVLRPIPIKSIVKLSSIFRSPRVITIYRREIVLMWKLIIGIVRLKQPVIEFYGKFSFSLFTSSSFILNKLHSDMSFILLTFYISFQ